MNALSFLTQKRKHPSGCDCRRYFTELFAPVVESLPVGAAVSSSGSTITFPDPDAFELRPIDTEIQYELYTESDFSGAPVSSGDVSQQFGSTEAGTYYARYRIRYTQGSSKSGWSDWVSDPIPLEITRNRPLIITPLPEHLESGRKVTALAVFDVLDNTTDAFENVSVSNGTAYVYINPPDGSGIIPERFEFVNTNPDPDPDAPETFENVYVPPQKKPDFVAAFPMDLLVPDQHIVVPVSAYTDGEALVSIVYEIRQTAADGTESDPSYPVERTTLSSFKGPTITSVSGVYAYNNTDTGTITLVMPANDSFGILDGVKNPTSTGITFQLRNQADIDTGSIETGFIGDTEQLVTVDSSIWQQVAVAYLPTHITEQGDVLNGEIGGASIPIDLPGISGTTDVSVVFGTFSVAVSNLGTLEATNALHDQYTTQSAEARIVYTLEDPDDPDFQQVNTFHLFEGAAMPYHADAYAEIQLRAVLTDENRNLTVYSEWVTEDGWESVQNTEIRNIPDGAVLDGATLTLADIGTIDASPPATVFSNPVLNVTRRITNLTSGAQAELDLTPGETYVVTEGDAYTVEYRAQYMYDQGRGTISEYVTDPNQPVGGFVFNSGPSPPDAAGFPNPPTEPLSTWLDDNFDLANSSNTTSLEAATISNGKIQIAQHNRTNLQSSILPSTTTDFITQFSFSMTDVSTTGDQRSTQKRVQLHVGYVSTGSDLGVMHANFNHWSNATNSSNPGFYYMHVGGQFTRMATPLSVLTTEHMMEIRYSTSTSELTYTIYDLSDNSTVETVTVPTFRNIDAAGTWSEYSIADNTQSSAYTITGMNLKSVQSQVPLVSRSYLEDRGFVVSVNTNFTGGVIQHTPGSGNLAIRPPDNIISWFEGRKSATAYEWIKFTNNGESIAFQLTETDSNMLTSLRRINSSTARSITRQRGGTNVIADGAIDTSSGWNLFLMTTENGNHVHYVNGQQIWAGANFEFDPLNFVTTEVSATGSERTKLTYFQEFSTPQRVSEIYAEGSGQP